MKPNGFRVVFNKTGNIVSKEIDFTYEYDGEHFAVDVSHCRYRLDSNNTIGFVFENEINYIREMCEI